MRARQLSFLPAAPRTSHGGDIRKGRRKLARPIDPRSPLHVVLRATQARGHWSMLRKPHKGKIHLLVHEKARRYGVRIYRYANVGNHLHLLVLPGSRRGFQSFLRTVTGGVAFLVTGTRKGHGLKMRFWDQLAYSRLVSWGREFKIVSTYFAKNLLESLRLPRAKYALRPIPE